MAGGKISPRQKMINMMYLVLTALLALNISKDMLKAFTKVNNSLKENLHNMNNHAEAILEEFKEAAVNNPVKASASYEIASIVQHEAEIFRNYVDSLQNIIIEATGGVKQNGDFKGADNKSLVSNLMLKKPHMFGAELRQRMSFFRDHLLDLDIIANNTEIRNIIISKFKTDKILKDGERVPVSWEYGTFNNVPMVAVLTFLSQFEVNATFIESQIVENLYASISADDMKFSTVDAQVMVKKSYVMQGDTFKADISLAAYDTTQAPIIVVTDTFIGDTLPDYSVGDTIPVEFNGTGTYVMPAKGIGVQKRASKILLTTESGVQEFEKIFEYQVAKSMAVVSPTKMNVFYKGIPNPIEVSAPGFSPEDISVSGTNVSLKKIGPGQYEASVPKDAKGEAKIIVKANNQRIGDPIVFRLKKIPNPGALINGRSSGKMSRSKLAKAQGIVAKLRDFPFDLKYRVTSFTCNIKDGEYTRPIKVTGNKFTPELREKILKLKPGQDVTFSSIKTQGPNGIKATIDGALLFKLQ